MNIKKAISFLLFFVLFTPTAHADSDLVPAHLLKWPETGSDYAVLVDKSTQKVLVFQKGALSKPVKTYRCSTGENNGPKSRKNDKKTPEGVYFFTKSFVKRQLSSTYGILAFPIDYPNQMDKKQGKSGYGIWFHGTDEVLKPRDTNGCVVLENSDIKDLASYINLYETPVIITEIIEMVPCEKLKAESRHLEKLIEKWARAWEKKDIDGYIGIYSQQFSSRGMDVNRWRDYKTRLARKYGKIHVNIENLQLFKAQDNILAKFDQTYATEGFKSRGTKRLYLAKNSNKWRIVGEFFSETEEKEAPSFPSPTTLQEVENFVGSWKSAWEKKDLRTYISFYDKNFKSGGMDLKAWEEYKAHLNMKYNTIKVEISKIRITQQESRYAEVCFRQNYTADAYHDIGIKKLMLVKEENHWKIRKEMWHPVPMSTKQ